MSLYGVLIAIGAFGGGALGGPAPGAGGGSRVGSKRWPSGRCPAASSGARLYHVATDPELFGVDGWPRSRCGRAASVFGAAVAGGVLAGALVARRRGFGLGPLLDAAAPAIPLAQAIGRWGNWFNQELFRAAHRAAWGLRIDPAHRPPATSTWPPSTPRSSTKSLWDLAVVAIVPRRRAPLPAPTRPALSPVYVVAYTFGRFFVELLRIDTSHRMLGPAAQRLDEHRRVRRRSVVPPARRPTASANHGGGTVGT